MSTRLRHPSDPTEDIKKAIEKLATFNQQNDTATLGSLEKTIDLMRGFLSVKFRPEKMISRKKNECEILNAIDILKSNYLILEKLQKGTPQQQKFAASVLGVINRYNSIIDKAQLKSSSFGARIASFLAEQNGNVQVKNLAKIHFPLHAMIHKDFSEREEVDLSSKKYSPEINAPFVAAASKKISFLSHVVVPPISLPMQHVPHLSKQGIELFYMKVIALVEKHTLLSKAETRQAVRMARLHTALQPDSTCLVACTLTPFPGQTIVVNATFEKSPRSTDYAIPISKSFKLTLTSTQTGFPHPSQHTAWALSDLVPNYPHHLEELPLLKPIYEKKQKMAHELLSNEKLIVKAKKRMRLKKLAFEKNKEIFLGLHLQLAETLVASSQAETNLASIADFYKQLSHVHNPFDYLAETHCIINENFCMRAQEKIKQAWIERGKGDFTARHILEEETAAVIHELSSQETSSELERATIAYILTMGKILSSASQSILLQYLSEGMNFAPPILTEFELKCQIIMYKQLINFLNSFNEELILDDLELIEKTCQLLQNQLKTEIELLSSKIIEDDPEVELVRELETYYSSRYIEKM